MRPHNRYCRLGALGPLFGLVLGLGPASARQVPIDITGSVLDVRTDAPVRSALVVVARGLTSWTDPEGRFHVRDVPPGEFVFSVERAGFDTRVFNLVVPDTAAGTIDIGVVLLTPGDPVWASIRGGVTNRLHGQAIAGALVVVDGEVAALTEGDGTFLVDSVEVGVHHFEVRRVGYFPAAEALRLAQEGVVVDMAMQPLPIRLDDVEVVAEGDRTIYVRGRLGDFYRRRRTTEGTFFTREEVEKYATVFLSDLMFRTRGAHLRYGASGRRVPVIRGCRARILLDGFEVRDMGLDDIPPSWVEAVEVHAGAFVPVELMRSGQGSCGVIAIWTR